MCPFVHKNVHNAFLVYQTHKRAFVHIQTIHHISKGGRWCAWYVQSTCAGKLAVFCPFVNTSVHNAFLVYQTHKHAFLQISTIRNTTEENTWCTPYEHAICVRHAAVPVPFVYESVEYAFSV